MTISLRPYTPAFGCNNCANNKPEEAKQNSSWQEKVRLAKENGANNNTVCQKLATGEELTEDEKILAKELGSYAQAMGYGYEANTSLNTIA